MALQDSVKSLMHSNVISVLPETSVLAAIDIILGNNFNGIPVTDKDGKLAGILTKYDLIIKRNSIRDDSKVGDVMNVDPLFLSDDMTVENAISAFSEHHKVDPIPVIDAARKVVGIISRSDMVRLFREYGILSANAKPSISKSSDGDKRSILPLIIIVVLAVLGITAYYIY